MSVTHITTCLDCPPEKPVRIVANEIPRVDSLGEPTPPAVGRYVQTLSTHLEKKHPEVYRAALLLSQSMFAFLVLTHYETSDPGVVRGRNEIRAFIHKLTRANDPTEHDLLMRQEQIIDVTGPELPPDIERRIMEGLRDLRDYLLEEGDYAPVPPEPQAITTA
jgi:hypothetical protein